MALLSDQSLSGMELLDLLLEQADGNSHPEGPGGGLANPAWPITDQSLLYQSEDVADQFLDSLLCVSECASDPGSPLWVPSPCDSGISEDPQSDQRETPPPPSSPLFHSFYHPQVPLPQAQPQQQLQRQQAGSALNSTEPDVSIDVAAWESSVCLYRPVESQCESPENFSMYQLSVKDLLLSSMGEPPKLPSQNSLQELILNDDEKKLLAKEGVCLSSQLPLTKYEEKVLKKIRRKIRNKQSAQESRKKKKEYVDGLEGRMASCSAQNLELQKKVIQLEKTNTSLMEQLRRLQALVMNGSCKPAHTGTCILVLLMSFSLILFPSLRPVSLNRAGQPGDFTTARVQSRSLRSVLEVHSLQPVLTLDSGIETASPMITKMHIRPEYADMDPPPHNRSYGDQEHHHGDPITGHMGTLGWLSHPDSGPYHQEGRK
ncbi:cyclic AMP-responsive element-binding protein 3-like protein 3-B [Salminus brasiliensis]|uniref:cyclic AMP-responsive element-binding protein 3-like protein 3-B n=1 Tax=Salminus brasiliensis TaxID=930266 RepID=UPI003B831BDB